MTTFIKWLNFSKITSNEAAFVIRLGTFCRTLWPIFPPILLYQYIRQTDMDKFATELLYLRSNSNNAAAFDNPTRPSIAGHWRIQKDLDTIWKAANSGLTVDEISVS